MENQTSLQEQLARREKEIVELKRRNEELEDFVENASIPLHWVNEEGIIVWANQAELDLLGYTANEYIGKPITDFHVDQLVINDILTKLSANQTLYNYRSAVKCKDGSIKQVIINSNVFRKDGKFIHSRCLTRDITSLVEEESREKAMLTALEVSESRLRLAIALTHLGTWEWHIVNNELLWSMECRNIYGVPADLPITFELLKQLTHPEDLNRVQETIQQALNSTDGTYEISNRIITYNNQSIRWIKVIGRVFFGPSKQPERFIGTVIDFTENKLIQDKILASEKLFKSIALNIPKSLIIVIDKDHHFITIEGDIMQKLGYDSSIFTGKHPKDIAPLDRYEATKHLYNRMLAGEKFSVERKSETGEDYMVHFVPLKNDQEEVEAGLIIALDISDIKAAEERSAKLVAIIESSDDAIVSKTLESMVTSWNDSAERIFGYTAAEMIGQSILKIIPPDRTHEETQILNRLKKGERMEHFETKRLRKDGNLIDVSLTISPIKDPAGNIIGLSKIARDITEKKQEEQRKNDFVAIVSHELKTPLTSITGYIQLLLGKSKREGNEQYSNILTRVDVQARKMAVMIQDFLDLAKMEDGKIQLNLEIYDIKELIEEITSDPQFISSRHQLKLTVPANAMIQADRGKIGQVLINLLGNAIKYSPNGGTITIGTTIEGEQVKIYVNDQGLGISPLHQKRLFDRFYRINDDRIKSVSGFGLGLYLVAEILRYHGSNISLTSEEGVGSTFYFNLPIAHGA